MKIVWLTFLSSTLLFLSMLTSYSQGCSDAGFCTMGAMKPDQRYDKKLGVKLRSVELSYYLAFTRFEGGQVRATTLETNVGFGKKMVAQLKIPYMQTRGHWGASGLGDISVSVTRNFIDKEAYKLNATIGAKIPSNGSDIGIQEGLDVPSYYQTSLGTYDLVFGASFITRDWLFATGLQMPLNENKNNFSPEFWPPILPQRAEDANLYARSISLKRGNDIMFRIERNFRFSRLSFNLGLLPIYRLNKDIVTDPETGERVKADKSDGLALSLLAGVTYRFSVKSHLKFIFGQRIIEREINPDGLSREQVFTLGYLFNF